MRLRRRGGGAGPLGDDPPRHGFEVELSLCGGGPAGETVQEGIRRLRLEAEAVRALHTCAEEMLIEQRER
jgi:hypothetical protein